jgi:hypothetical protein
VITISGGAVQPSITLTPNANAQYQTDLVTGDLLFVGGETLTFSAQGGDAPAFEADLVAPSFITVTQPVFTGAAFAITLGDDLEVAWTGGDEGVVSVFLVRALGPGEANKVECTFPASAGAGTVPATALEVLGTGAGSMSVTVQNEQTLELADDWRVRVLAYSSGGVPGGTGGDIASAQVQFQ